MVFTLSQICGAGVGLVSVPPDTFRSGVRLISVLPDTLREVLVELVSVPPDTLREFLCVVGVHPS
jgi:hypothetical protein